MTIGVRTHIFSRRKPTPFLPAIEPLGQRFLPAAGFFQSNLISDVPGLAQFTDSNLVNPWGISTSRLSPWWFADNGTGFSTVTSAMGPASNLNAIPPVAIPGVVGAENGAVTGTVFNSTPGFQVSNGAAMGPSRFLFAAEDGSISGWSPDVQTDRAFIAVDNSATPGIGPVYTGLAIAATPTGSFLYAANFRAGTIDVFDSHFDATSLPGGFRDPNLPAGYVPFNVQTIGSTVYVAYTAKNNGRYDGNAIAGNGVVDAFDPRGDFLHRVATGGQLDTPWGLAVAPADFGTFANALLVGNFGDGRISAYDPVSGKFLGTLSDGAGQPIVIPDLWALSVGNGDGAGRTDTLYFTAGIGDESHGLFGSLQPVSFATGTASQGEALLGNFLQQPSADGTDAYPIPPSGGPATNSVAGPANPAAVVLLPVDGSGVHLAPTLLSPSPANTASTLPAQVYFSQQSFISSVALAGQSTNLAAARTLVANPDPLGVPGRFGSIDFIFDLAGPGGASGSALASSLAATSNSVFAGQFDRDGTGVMSQVNQAFGEVDAVISGRMDTRQLLRGEVQQPPEHAAMGWLLGPSGPHGGWFSRTARPFVAVLAVACSVQYMRLKAHLPVAVAWVPIRSLWTRLTRRPAITGDLHWAEMPPTRVLD
jgi:uncharacterized protein (TIGR03118 family)